MSRPSNEIGPEFEFPSNPQTDFDQPTEGCWRRFRWLIGGIVVIVAAYFLNRYMATHQTLHLVNRLPGEVTVTIDGRGEGIRLGQQRQTVAVSEGSHQAVIRDQDGVETTIDFEIRNSLWQRYFGDSAFILNPGGAAHFLWEQTVYSTSPDPNEFSPYRVHFGEEFLALRDIDYPFEEFPDEIELPSESSRVTKSRVDVLDLPPMQVMALLPDDTQPDEYLRYAEHHLNLDPEDVALLQMYFVLSAGMEQLDRCRTFLEGGLSRKPVAIEWHRLYQRILDSAEDEEAVIARYDQLLTEDPESSGLLYLRGRIGSRVDEASKYFDRAIAADAENPYPYFAKSYVLVSRAEYEQAKPLAAKAVELSPDHPDMARILFEIRFALGEYAPLEAELKETLEENPADFTAQERLLRVLVADGRVQEATAAHRQFAERAGAPEGPDDEDLPLQSELALKYFTGELEGWLAAAQRSSDPDSAKAIASIANLELGNLEEAEKAMGEDASQRSGYVELLFSLAWKQKGNQAEADRWLQTAIESLASGSRLDALAAELLRKGDRVDVGEVDQLRLEPRMKAIVLVALADAGPTHRKELLDRAEKLNALRGFPYQFLKRTIEKMRNQGSASAASP